MFSVNWSCSLYVSNKHVEITFKKKKKPRQFLFSDSSRGSWTQPSCEISWFFYAAILSGRSRLQSQSETETTGETFPFRHRTGQWSKKKRKEKTKLSDPFTGGTLHQLNPDTIQEGGVVKGELPRVNLTVRRLRSSVTDLTFSRSVSGAQPR